MDEKMKTVFAALGLVLLFIGLIMIAFSNICYEKWSQPMSIGIAKNSWTVSANYSSGEGLYVNIVANQKWLEIYEIGDPETIFQYGYIILHVDVIDPYGDKTRFQYRWVRWPSRTDPSVYVLLPESSTILQNGSLIESESLKEEHVEPCGVVRYKGTYTVNITVDGEPAVASYHYPRNPPVSTELVKLVTITVQPYSYILPMGVASFFSGAAASIFGVKSKKTKRKEKAMKKKAMKKIQILFLLNYN